MLSVYLPGDNYSMTAVNKDYINCINYIETLYNRENCHTLICCGDYNSSFERSNAQIEYLNDFNSRNHLNVTWRYNVSVKDFTYINTALKFILALIMLCAWAHTN